MIIAVGAASIAAGVLYTGGPRPYGYAGHGRAVRLPLLRPRRRQRLLLRAARGARLAAVLALDLGRAARRPRSSSSTTSATSRPTAAPASARSRSGSAASAPGASTRRWSAAPSSSSPSGSLLADGPAWALLGLLAAPLALAGRCGPCSTRTDGPALNGALAGTGALLGAFSLLRQRRPADRGLADEASPRSR